MKNLFFSVFSLLIVGALNAQSILLSEDFQSGIPANWTIVDNDGSTPHPLVSEYTNAWISKEDPEDILNLTASSTSYFNPIGKADKWLITPPLTIVDYGTTFSWKAKSHDPSYPDSYLVLISTTNLEMNSFTDTIGYIQEENAEWTFRTVNLSLLEYGSGTIYIAFVNISNDAFKLYLDDITCITADPVYVKEVEKINIQLFPNPVHDKLYINSDEEIKNLAIYSLEGKLIRKYNGFESFIHVGFLTQGAYLIEVETSKGISKQRIIKN
jgi:hypothetical protein